MCGIAGIFRASGGAEADQASLSAMLRCMAHRGPNGQGTFADGPVTMGMVRLSIIDLAGGQQPLYNEDKSIALVCNGEVYNFVELRADLEARGHTFRTGSDLETLTHLYEDHGDDFVQHLRGMYAGALWDAKRCISTSPTAWWSSHRNCGRCSPGPMCPGNSTRRRSTTTSTSPTRSSR
jgi:asparagine synthase (glutamine-hydrolysing)